MCFHPVNQQGTLFVCHFTILNGDLLNERGSLKVLDGLLTELGVDVVSPQPLNHIDVGGEISERLDSETRCLVLFYFIFLCILFF